MPWLAWLTSPRIGLARLACTSNNSSGAPRRPAAFGSWVAWSAAAVVAGAGKASEANARRGEPSKPSPGEYADPHTDNELR